MRMNYIKFIVSASYRKEIKAEKMEDSNSKVSLSLFILYLIVNRNTPLNKSSPNTWFNFFILLQGILLINSL